MPAVMHTVNCGVAKETIATNLISATQRIFARVDIFQANLAQAVIVFRDRLNPVLPCKFV